MVVVAAGSITASEIAATSLEVVRVVTEAVRCSRDARFGHLDCCKFGYLDCCKSTAVLVTIITTSMTNAAETAVRLMRVIFGGSLILSSLTCCQVIINNGFIDYS